MGMAYQTARWLHLVAMATWAGGIITLAVLMITLKRRGTSPDDIRAVARAFARLSWTAMAVAIASGVAQVALLHLPWSHPPLHLKLGAVAFTIVVAMAHQLLAGRMSPRNQRMVEALLLASTLATVAAAIRL